MLMRLPCEAYISVLTPNTFSSLHQMYNFKVLKNN